MRVDKGQRPHAPADDPAIISEGVEQVARPFVLYVINPMQMPAEGVQEQSDRPRQLPDLECRISTSSHKKARRCGDQDARGNQLVVRPLDHGIDRARHPFPQVDILSTRSNNPINHFVRMQTPHPGGLTITSEARIKLPPATDTTISWSW